MKKAILKKTKQNGFQDQLWLNAGQKYCRMLQGEHSAILSTFIKLPIVIKIFVLSIFEWPFWRFTQVILYSWYVTLISSIIPGVKSFSLIILARRSSSRNKSSTISLLCLCMADFSLRCISQ